MLPPDAVSLDEAHAAIELWEFYKRRRLDPSQRLVVEVMRAVAAAGNWAAATTGREMPRQNGKGDEIEVVELWGIVERGEAILHTVHDAALLATQAQQRLLSVIEGHADLRRRLLRRHIGVGQQMTEMRNGGIIWYRTRTAGGGRGVDNVDRLVVDEAQHATEEHLAAISPTLLANPNPQMNALGSAGIAGKSGWWWSQRRRALSPAPGRFGYVGHTAERVSLDADGLVVQEPVDVENRRLWHDANPALGAGRGGGMAYLEEQLLRLGPALFAREHLGVWDPDDTAGGSVFPPGTWDKVNGIDYEPSGPLSFSLDVNPERTAACLAVSGGGTAEVVAHLAGVHWVIDRVEEVVGRWSSQVAIHEAGPAGSFIAELEQRGVKVLRVPEREFTQACGQFYDAVVDGSVRLRRHPALTAAANGARKKQSGDAWKWARRDATVDVSPLVAVTLAYRTAVVSPPPATPGFVDLSDFLDEED